jgi:hypothetical protein
MLATFNGTWDWTAIGTLVLAFVTLLLAGATFWMVKLTRGSLAQTKDEIALSRREVEEAHRPVLVPVVLARPPDLMPQSVSRSGRTFPDRPSVAEPGVLAVPVKNIGSGPALRVVASIERLDEQGDTYSGAIERQMPGEVAGIGKDQTVPIEIGYHDWEERWNFQLRLMYEDVAGKQWATVSRYMPERRRYDGLCFEALAARPETSSSVIPSR